MTATQAMSDKNMNGRTVTNLGTPSASTDAATKAYVDTGVTTAESRANHTGTQLAATVSDFDTQVRTSRLDQMAAPTGSVSMGSQRITSVTDPSGAQDAATKNYVDSQLSSTTAGLVLKGAVVAAATTNVTISSPGTTIDGITASNGQVFLLTGQSTGTQNGPYVYNGSGSAMTRATNWDSSGEAVVGSYWVVEQGSNADKFALMTNDTFVFNTDTPTFTFIGAVTGSATTGYTTTSPSVSAGGTWTVTHNLGSKNVLTQVYRTASPYDEVDVYVARTTTNTLSVIPDVAMNSGDFTVVVCRPAGL